MAIVAGSCVDFVKSSIIFSHARGQRLIDIKGQYNKTYVNNLEHEKANGELIQKADIMLCYLAVNPTKTLVSTWSVVNQVFQKAPADIRSTTYTGSPPQWNQC